MEQESGKKLIENSTHSEPENNSPIFCANNCGFFGNAATNNLCSKCYKDYVLKQSKIDSVIEEINKVDGIDQTVSEKSEQIGVPKVVGIDEGASSENRPANRCNFCRKKVGLMGFKCRCEQTFCSIHRYSDKHNCVFDYKGAGQDAIAKANPIVKADKIEKL